MTTDPTTQGSEEIVVRREFFWSGRTLRCDVWVKDEVLGEFLRGPEDCLAIDSMRCIVAFPPYDTLIPHLLNAHFSEGLMENERLRAVIRSSAETLSQVCETDSLRRPVEVTEHNLRQALGEDENGNPL